MLAILKLDRPKNSLVVLEGVRAIACLVVIWYHINLATRFGKAPDHLNTWSPEEIGELGSRVALVGWSGVTLFFVLSGFLLFMPFAKALLFDTPWPGTRQFYLRRIFRIWPGYYISLILLILLTHPEYLQWQHWQETFLFVTFFMDSAPETYLSINPPYWTLAVEWQFYLLLPFLAWGMRWIVQRGSLQRRLWMLTSCLLAMVVWGLLMRWLFWEYSWMNKPAPEHPLFGWARFFLYGWNGKYLEDFAIGMFAGTCYVLAQQTSFKHRIVTFCQKHALWLWQAGISWLVLATIWSLLPFGNSLQPHLTLHSWLADFIFAPGFAICILALLFGPRELRRPFEWGPLCWIGTLSYALYIWHMPILNGIMPVLLPLIGVVPGWLLYCLTWLGVLLITIPLSYLFYRLVEQPFMQLSNRLFKKPVAKPRPPEPPARIEPEWTKNTPEQVKSPPERVLVGNRS